MRYTTVKDGQWFQPKPGSHYMRCCGCGLVHRMDFRVVLKGRVLVGPGLAVQMRAFRLKRKRGAE